MSGIKERLGQKLFMQDSIRKKAKLEEDRDRISKLSDDVIHRILSSLDARLAVQTSVLSKRWKLVWTTLPFLNFYRYDKHREKKHSNFLYSNLMYHIFSRRDRGSRLLKLELCPDSLYLGTMKKCIRQAILHEVECVHVKADRYCSLSTFSSVSLKELKLTMKLKSVAEMESNCWTLPHLTTLILKSNELDKFRKVPESCLICLPALTTLSLEKCELPELFSLPCLTTLILERCLLPKKVWDFPALITLELINTGFPGNMSDYFLALASLKNLVIDFGYYYTGRLVISSSQLVNLKIKVSSCVINVLDHRVVVLAPKLCNFEAIGFFRMAYKGSELENANIKFWDWSSSKDLKNYQDVIETMFLQLGSAKILSLDMVTIQVLSQNQDILARLPCPFYNLKYLKLPRGCQESSISGAVRKYLLGGSPSATIVKPMPRDNVIPQIKPAVSLVNQNLVQGNTSRTLTKKLNDTTRTNKSTGKVQQIKTPVAVASNVPATTSGNNSSRGLGINSEFLGLLDVIKEKYPETFRQLPTKNKKILIAKLNTFCYLLTAYNRTPKTEFNTEMLAEYRALFTDLQRWGFNLNWLMSNLNYIEQL